MKESDYKVRILKKLDDGPATIGTLKTELHQGNKITNLRKAFHKLLKKGEIELDGYDNRCKSFKMDCFRLKKMDINYKNPIYVKKLLEDPYHNKNFLKIREIFKKRIEEVNTIFIKEITILKESIEKMPLKMAIKQEYIKPRAEFKSTLEINDNKLSITLREILNKYPDVSIWYFKKKFISKMAMINIQGNFPNFGSEIQIDLILKDKNSYIQKYYRNQFPMLPIENWKEDYIFRQLVIEGIKNRENKKKILWDIACELTEEGPGLIQFVNKLYIADISLNKELEIKT
jgi:hypothetical protein